MPGAVRRAILENASASLRAGWTLEGKMETTELQRSDLRFGTGAGVS